MTSSTNHPLAAALPETNFGAGSLARTAVDHPGVRLSWYSRAIQESMATARAAGLGRVIVLGCDGFPRAEGLEITAVGEGAAPEGSGEGQWVQCGLMHATEVEEVPRKLSHLDGPALVVVLGLFERQADPRPLVRALKRLLLRTGSTHVIVAATDRERAAPKRTGNWPAPSHFREWSWNELDRYFEANGFSTSAMKRVGDDGVVAELHFSQQHYDSFLARLALPPSSLRELVLTTEYGKCRVSGGIGSYVEERMTFAADWLGMALLTDDGNLPASDVVDGEKWLLRSKLGMGPADPLNSETALKFVQQILPYYPNLEAVEFQEYLGIGARLIQARPAGLLARDLRLDVCCHGSHVYIENSFEHWLDAAALRTMTEERLCVEEADRIIFPTRFLAGLYSNAGYRIDPRRASVRRLPFRGFTRAPEELEVRAADTVIFFGKRTRMKGFPAFVAGLKKLLEWPEALSRLERVVLIGPVDDRLAEENAFIDELKSRLEVVELSLPRHEALKTLRRYAPGAVCVTPYMADNHPVAVLEVVASGCQLVATDRGGIPELIPERFHEQVLADPTGDELAGVLREALSLPASERAARVRELYAASQADQERINAGYLSCPDLPGPSAEAKRVPGQISVIVPCFNTDLRYVRELIWGLNHQTYHPAKVIFVDDGSDPEYAPQLQKLIQERLRFPFELIRHSVNRGLAAARNTALKRVTTEYVVNIDSDDIPKNDFLHCYVDALNNAPEAVAVTSYADYFPDGRDWELVRNTEPEGYRPHGAGVIWAQLENCLGHANSAFRVAALREAGGWDDSDNSKWEDYALLLQMASSGRKIGVVPRGTWLYRYRPDSMVRTYSKFPAERRVARALRGLDRFEALRLKAVLSRAEDRYQALKRENEQLKTERDALRKEFDRVRFKTVRNVVSFIERQPEIYETLREAHHRLTLMVEGYSMRRTVQDTLGAARGLITRDKQND